MTVIILPSPLFYKDAEYQQEGGQLAVNTELIDVDSWHGAFDHELKWKMVQDNGSAVFHED